jgi:hypothetical protein
MTSARRLTTFAFVWALATLNHQNYSGRFVNLEWASVLDFVALVVLLRPSSRRALLALATLQVLTLAGDMPRVSNHWLLMGAANLGLILWLGPGRGGTDSDDRGRVDGTASMIRSLLIITYGFAALAKLNAGFFDPVYSCAVEHYDRVVETLSFLPTAAWTALPATLATLAIEVALAAGLALPRARIATLVLGWSFHLVLGWNGFYDFSLVAIGFYVMFLPENWFEGWARTQERWSWLGAMVRGFRRVARWPATLPLAMLALLALGQIGSWTELRPHELHLSANAVGKRIFVGLWFALGAVAVVSFLTHRGHSDPTKPVNGIRHSWRLWIPSALLVANGLMPYIGLKTEHSFTMFSNVQTEGDRWNHYVFPRWMRVFHFQDDLIRVIKTTDPVLQRIAGTEIRLVAFDLRNRVEANPGMKLQYEHRGRVFLTNAAGNDPLLGQDNPALLKRILLFRPVQPADANRCVH